MCINDVMHQLLTNKIYEVIWSCTLVGYDNAKNKVRRTKVREPLHNSYKENPETESK